MLHGFEFNDKHYLYDNEMNRIFSISNEKKELVETISADTRANTKEIFLERNRILKDSIDRQPFILLNFINSYVCNLNCEYCYAYKTKHTPKTIMSSKLAIESFDLILDFLQKSDPNYRTINIRFTGGGEPLVNFNLVKDLVEHVNSVCKLHKDKNYTVLYEVSTNGVEIDEEKINFFKENKFKIKISYDGDNEFHNKYRNNSADKVCKNIKYCIEKIGVENVTVACTTSNSFFDFKRSVINIRKLGVSNIRFNFNLNKNVVINESQVDEMIKNIQELFTYYYEAIKNNDLFRIDNIIDFILNILSDNYVSKKNTTCMAGITEIAITPSGEFYTCPRMCEYDSRFKIGNYTDGIDNSRRKELIDLTSIAHKSECLDCWAVFLCGGLCNYANIELTGDISKVYHPRCLFIRKMIEGSMWLSDVIERRTLLKLLMDARY